MNSLNSKNIIILFLSKHDEIKSAFNLSRSLPSISSAKWKIKLGFTPKKNIYIKLEFCGPVNVGRCGTKCNFLAQYNS